MIPRPIPEYLSIEEDLVALFQHLLAELPSNAASLRVQRVGRSSEGIQVTLTPKSSGAASLWAHAEKGRDLVDFGFGDWTNSWELPIEGRNPKAGKDEVLQEIRDLCKAVMPGIVNINEDSCAALQACRSKAGHLTGSLTHLFFAHGHLCAELDSTSLMLLDLKQVATSLTVGLDMPIGPAKSVFRKLARRVLRVSRTPICTYSAR